jgi:hypothetical protein
MRDVVWSGGIGLARVALVALELAASASAVCAQNQPDFERPPVNYSSTSAKDPVAVLLKRIAVGEVTLKGKDDEILRTVLHELHVPVESQVLVFSRTSLQAGRIRPSRPRALFFSDSVYVGWVPGALMEVAAIDPELGPVFYAFDPQDARDAKRTFVREESCLRCHGGTFVRDIPGLFARSLFTQETGEPLLRHGSELVDDTTPFERRWGGWYVTGYAGEENHRGNVFASENGNQLIFTPTEKRPTDLAEFFDISRYLAPTSDVVALLVFEHQLAMHNSLTRAGQSARRMIEYQHALQKSLGEPITDEPAYDSVKSVFAGAVEDVVDHLLFREAAPLPEGVKGSEAFKKAFAADARRGPRGDALKDFSLKGRLFATRCSFLIYSESFRALPAVLKRPIFERLAAVLRGEDPKGRYAYLEAEEKRRLGEILGATLPEIQPFSARRGSRGSR